MNEDFVGKPQDIYLCFICESKMAGVWATLGMPDAPSDAVYYLLLCGHPYYRDKVISDDRVLSFASPALP